VSVYRQRREQLHIKNSKNNGLGGAGICLAHLINSHLHRVGAQYALSQCAARILGIPLGLIMSHKQTCGSRRARGQEG
jgi:hypothetical protein